MSAELSNIFFLHTGKIEYYKTHNRRTQNSPGKNTQISSANAFGCDEKIEFCEYVVRTAHFIETDLLE